MLFELSIGIGLTIIIIAFFAEYIDSTLGMGYGTSLTPILLMLGFEPLQIVPAVLLSELFTGLIAGFTHHSIGNVDFRPKTLHIVKIINGIRRLGISESFRRGIPNALKITMFLTIFSFLGTIIAVIIAVNIPKLYLSVYIGFLVLIIGIVILITLRKSYKFSWLRLTFLGFIASFNKGISGGGYGPVVTGGQLLSGVNDKNAVAITSLAEGLTCLIGVIIYQMTNSFIDWSVAPYLILGALISVPFSCITVKKIRIEKLRIGIGIITILLGLLTLIKIIV